MPKLMKWLKSDKLVQPAVVDVSSPLSQKTFSRAFIKGFNTPFPTYVMPDQKSGPYIKALDSKWEGDLPFAALYSRGKKLTQWRGSYPIPEMKATVHRLCRKL